MPTNPPFFANFFAVFRAHIAVTKASSTATASNITTTASTTTSSPFATQTGPASAARSISTKATSSSQTQTQTSPGTTAAAVQAASQHLRQASTSPQAHTHTPPSIGGRHTSQSPLQSPTSPTRTNGWAARRRGSDSSSDSGGFREVLGTEKWYVGGRTAGGEEKFLALKMVRKEGSWERRSADQLSL